MNKKKKYLWVFFMVVGMLFTGCSKSETKSLVKQQESEVTPTPNVNSWETKQSNYILQQKPEYKNYVAHSFKLESAYVIVYEAPDANFDDFYGYYGDIWAYGEDWVTKVEENAYILPDTFGLGTLSDKEYFRYDLSYPTESVTVLLMLDETENLRVISLSGALYEANGYDLTVTRSQYDMLYLKSDLYACGHTWKPYYVYLEDYTIKDYETHEIEEEDFLKYKGAQKILDQLTEKYSLPEKELHMEFLFRDNGLIHINLMVESSEDITYFYETYVVQEDQSLVCLSTGEGTYGGLPSME